MDEFMLATPRRSIEANIGARRSSSRLQSLPKTTNATSDRSLSKTPQIPSSKSTSTPQASRFPQDDSSVPIRSLRKRKSSVNNISTDPIADALKPLTAEERFNWKGWVELESDPVLFDYILRQYGVKNVKIQEVFSLDDESLAALPQPVFGLVFLFKYRDDDADHDEHAAKCPKHVWFANQTTNNACATVSLMNIIMNVPEVDLGSTLCAFKASTQSLTPPYRGQSLSANSFIRNIHNSFARRMDTLNADLALDNDFDKWKRARRTPKRKKTQAPKKGKKQEEDDSGYHFIGYVPVAGEVWRLDGLQRQPVSLGNYTENWIDLARDNIMARIDQYADDGVEYSLLSLCKSPLSNIQIQLSTNMHTLLSLETSLSVLVPDYALFSPSLAIPFSELTSSFGLSTQCIGDPINCETAERRIGQAIGGDSDPGKLLHLYRVLVEEQRRLRDDYLREVEMVGMEDEQAERKKEDHSPLVYNALKMLTEAGVLRDIVKEAGL